MRMNQIISEADQLDELGLADVGRGLGKAARATAQGAGAVAGGSLGMGSAFAQGFGAGYGAVSGKGSSSPTGGASSSSYYSGSRASRRGYQTPNEQNVDLDPILDIIPTLSPEDLNLLKTEIDSALSQPAAGTPAPNARPAPRSSVNQQQFADALAKLTPDQVDTIRKALSAKSGGVSEGLGSAIKTGFNKLMNKGGLSFDAIMKTIDQMSPEEAKGLLSMLPAAPSAGLPGVTGVTLPPKSASNITSRGGTSTPGSITTGGISQPGVSAKSTVQPAGTTPPAGASTGSATPPPSSSAGSKQPSPGQIITGSDGKPYQWMGKLWASYNPATGKAGQVARREVGAELTQSVASGTARPYTPSATAPKPASSAPAAAETPPASTGAAPSTPTASSSPYGNLTASQQAFVAAREKEGLSQDQIKTALTRGGGGGGNRPPLTRTARLNTIGNIPDITTDMKMSDIDPASFTSGQQRKAELDARSAASIAAKSPTNQPTSAGTPATGTKFAPRSDAEIQAAKQRRAELERKVGGISEGFYSRFLDKEI